MGQLTVPYAASARWYARLLAAECGRMQGAESASPEGPTGSRRELARCVVRTATGEPAVLSVPLVGGARPLRRADGPAPRVAEYGGWRRVHWGTLSAAYGRAPYFDYLAPLLEQIYSHSWEYLADLNGAIHDVALAALRFRESVAPIAEARCAGALPPRWRETAAQIDPDLSILDALFRLGPEAILGLAAALDW